MEGEKSRTATAEERAEEHLEVAADSEVVAHTDTFDISRDALGRPLPKHYYLHWRFLGLTLGCMTSNNAAIAPYIIAVNCIPNIIAEFGPSSSILWIPISNTLALSVCMLVAGRLSDILGRRYFAIGGNVSGVIGGIIAARAQSVAEIVGGMVLMGLGAAIQLNFPVFIAEVVPNKHRSLWVGILFGTAAPCYGFGPYMAQVFGRSPSLTWRWGFWLGVIISGTSALCFIICYFPPKFQLLHVHHTRREALRRTDFVGILMFAGGIGMLVTGLNWAGQAYAWVSGQVLGTIIGGVVVLILFVIWELYYKGDQILPTHLFKQPGFVPMLAIATVGSCTNYGFILIWPQQVGYLLSGGWVRKSLLAGVQGNCTLVGFISAGFILYWVRQHRILLCLTCALLTAMSGAMISVQPGDDIKAPVFLAFATFSIGLIETTARTLIPLFCPDEDIGAAIGILGSIGYGATSITTAIYSTILHDKITSIIPKAIIGAALEAGLPKSSVPALLTDFSTNITAVPGMTEDIAVDVGIALSQGYADVFRYIWYATLAFSLCALVASVFAASANKLYTDGIARRMNTNVKEKGDVESSAVETREAWLRVSARSNSC